jgi:hypothetical protein
MQKLPGVQEGSRDNALEKGFKSSPQMYLLDWLGGVLTGVAAPFSGSKVQIFSKMIK